MNFNIEILGYVAAIFTLVSLSFKCVLKLRILNLIGAVFWVLYGIKSHSKPVIIVNIAVIVIQIYSIYMLLKYKENS